MLQLRVRLVTDAGEVDSRSRRLETLDVSMVQNGGSPTLSFKVSRDTFNPTVYPFVVRVDYAIDGGRFQKLPEHELFIVETDSDDSKDDAKVVTYKAIGYVPWLLAGAYVGTGPFAKDNERTLNDDRFGQKGASAGQILAYFVDESQSRGWLTPLSKDFDWYRDSAGADWVAGDMAKIGWRLETFYNKVLEQLLSQGLCDWSAKGTTLRVFRPGTRGVDRSDEIVFGGPAFERVPVKTDMTGWYTHVVALSDAGRVHVQNTAAESRFGRRSVAMSQSGVKDTATSTKLANELLADGLEVRREEAYEWTPAVGDLVPFRDFNIGDMVTALARGGKRTRRVLGLVIRQQDGPATVQARVGEKITTLAAKQKKLLSSVSVGGVVGGSGDAFPATPGLPTAAPEPPNGVHVTSNEGSWAADGTARSVVALEWAAVTAATDGAEVDVVEYEVWSRLPSGTLARDIASTGPAVVVESWLPEQDRLAAVRAKSSLGVWSDFSLELLVTPEAPASLVPKAPGTLTVAKNVGAFTPAGAVASVDVTVPAVTQSTDDQPIDVTEYELWVDGAPRARFPSSPVSFTMPSDAVAKARVRAKSSLDVWGDLSAELSVTGAKPTVQSGRTPNGLTLKTGSGVVVAVWAGTYTSAPAANTMLRVDVEARVGTGAWIVQGSLDKAGDRTLKTGAIGDTVDVRLVAYDRLGRVIGTSATSQIVVKGVELGDLDADITAELNALDAGVAAAQSAAGAAQTTANTAKSDAAAAATAAGNAQTTANTAKSDAAAAAGIAGGKADVLIQSAAPAAAMQKATTLWIDTTGGANTPKRWSGSAWVVVTDKAATDAAAAAAAAQSAANTADGKAVAAQTAANNAQSKADTAFANAAAAATAAGQAQSTADGKNRVWYLATAPTGTAHKKDDVWFDTANGMRMSFWNVTTSSWTLAQFGTAAIAALSITNALIANAAIDNAKIANVDAGKVTTGFLAAARIAAYSLTAEKLLIGSREDLVPDPWFSGSIMPITGGTLLDAQATEVPQTGIPALARKVLKLSTRDNIPFGADAIVGEATPGTRLRFEMWVVAASTTTRPIQHYLYRRQTPVAAGSGRSAIAGLGTQAPVSTWTKVVSEYTVPDGGSWAGYPYLQPFIQINNVIGVTPPDEMIWYVTGWSVKKMVPGELIVDGEVKARHIEADEAFFNKVFTNILMTGRVKVDHLEPNAGSTLNLSGNAVAINLNSRLDEVNTQAENAQQTADQAVTDAADAAADAATAAQAVNALAAGRVLTAETALAALSGKIDTYENSFLFLSDGLHIRESETAKAEMVLTSAGARLMADGVVASEWNQGQMIVDQIIANGGRIGNHVLDASLPGLTVWRSI